jgi:heterodisulfide reductase subunit C
MIIEHMAASKITELKSKSARGACLGCTTCTGFCNAILEMMTVPQTVLASKAAQ